MYVLCVRVQVVPEKVEEFIEATLLNARETRKEAGNARFDVLRSTKDPARFFLYEVYGDEDALRAHQQTPHYLEWRERVAPMMGAPRQGDRH
ncbi:MAG: antibiotic biosynthesis monooxygenase, partial [Candidatus Methylomirabilales bacterium]